jgi:hypothetical protein
VLNRLAPLAPLSGLVFSILGVAAFVTANGAPALGDSGERVISFYVANGTRAMISDSLWFLAFAFFVLFAGALRARLRDTPAGEALGSVSLAGAAMAAVGAGTYFGFDYSAASVPGQLAPAAAQALNVLALEMFVPLGIGGLVFCIATWLAILRTRKLPVWLGWLALVIALLLPGPGALAGIVALFVWTAIAAVMLWRRDTRRGQAAGSG